MQFSKPSVCLKNECMLLQEAGLLQTAVIVVATEQVNQVCC
jgi:hypothetical protein